MSQELFDRLRRNSRRKLHVKQEKMSVRLADGSISKKPCKNVWLSVKSHQLARPQRLNFIVMSGSQNLLGRWAMYKLWLHQFSAFESPASRYKVDLGSGKHIMLFSIILLQVLYVF